MDIDAGPAVGILGHHTGDHGDLEKKELMGQTVDGGSQKTRIAQHDLVQVEGRRVSVKGGPDVRIDIVSDPGDPVEELHHDGRRPVLPFLVGFLLLSVIQDNGHLLSEVIGHVFDQDGDPVIMIVAPVVALPVVAGKDDVQKLSGDIEDDLLVGLIEDIGLVYVSSLLVILQDLVGNAADLGSHVAVVHLYSLLQEIQRFLAFSSLLISWILLSVSL